MQNNLFENYYVWWKNIDKIIFVIILGLFLLGLFFSLVSTSIIASDKLSTNSYYFFVKHLIFIILSAFIFILLSYLDKNKVLKFCIIFFFISFIFLLLVPFLGVEVKGSKRWLDFGFLPRFQPVELLKPFIIVLLSTLFTVSNFRGIYYKYLLSLTIVSPVILLLILQPDIGQSILITLVWFSLIFVSGINLLLFFSFFVFLGSTLIYSIIFFPKFSYIKLRLISFFRPETGNTYQSDRASEAIMNGGLFGKGIGEGTLNSKVPEAHTDYIISVISEEFGAVVVIVIMLIYLLLSFQVMKKIDKEKDPKIKLILLGCITLLLLQTFIHVGVNIGILPTTGMTLPFLSYGGSSIISTAILSGIILNFTKREI